MLDVLSSLKSLLRIDPVCVDNIVFRLHYKATVVILLAFSILVTTKQYLGDPIDCIVGKDSEVSSDIMDTYCWIHSTFTVSKHFNKVVGKEVSAPGVGPHIDNEDEVTYHQYYQWVCFVLFLQAVMFYLPYYIWNIFESGKMSKMVQSIRFSIEEEEEHAGKKDKSGEIVKTGTKYKQLKLLADYMVSNLGHSNNYAIIYIVSEMLNLLNVGWQLYFMNLFFGGLFLSYGTDVVSFVHMDQKDRTDPMVILFPRLTKCTFHTYGSSGNIQTYDSQCVLPLNILNEKIYIFLWFWFVILAVITAVAFVYRVCVVGSKKIRELLLRLQARTSSSGKSVRYISQKCQLGDWFLIYHLGKNLSPVIYREFVDILCENLEKTS